MSTNDMIERPLILIVNDDGITAPGIRNLVEAVHDLGEVVVVAPDSPQSGMGHAITIGKPLRLNASNEFQDLDIEAHACTGTPVDCVKLASDIVLKRRPAICLSGINHGSNVSINVIYSGTMSAAMEAAVNGIPSAGFSLLDFSYDADFSVSKKVVRQVAEFMLKEQLPKYFLINVNIPKVSDVEFKGLKICRQADAFWSENFESRTDPYERPYYWVTGQLENRDTGSGTDIQALEEGYASIVPITIDFTQHDHLEFLKEKENNLLGVEVVNKIEEH
ncbi:MAG TPA: 5'/3'-nucleotidase SurE [Chitinophagaceae bacterium]|nr:5'/3'-nucleotidase SurE [Chitinophagaceae bacterium]